LKLLINIIKVHEWSQIGSWSQIGTFTLYWCRWAVQNWYAYVLTLRPM